MKTESTVHKAWRPVRRCGALELPISCTRGWPWSVPLWTRTLWGLWILLVVEDASFLHIYDFYSTIQNWRFREQGKQEIPGARFICPCFSSFFLAAGGRVTLTVVCCRPRTYQCVTGASEGCCSVHPPLAQESCSQRPRSSYLLPHQRLQTLK